ncbi:MAG: hypothetical protein WBC44_18450 [Planctomycetaceae bacterium]
MTAPESKRSVTKPLLIGCGIALVLLLLCGGLLVYLGGRGLQVFQAGFEQAKQDEEFAQQWQAPVDDASDAVFAPQSVAGYELDSSDENARFPALGIEQEGTHAVYKQDGDTIDVAVYRMTEAEKSAVFDEIIRRIDDDGRFQSHSHLRLSRSLRFDVRPPDLHGLLWHADGWLVFVRSQTVADLDPFLKAYLEAVETSPDASAEPTPLAE